ncbi:putative inactive tyrosine-protein kinase Wsck [Macrosteles quadrilineatus]|uniref:putative inactive tyrosine-protein kinase Wsck n=1 Tax=Macrosteles quadrilineatus TaxID=74068 RepID=UPI0023E1CB80|nr:putative inactive tyrosine-protein kinase Wsck [Macrosteles quadrilineatus]XP_054280028.1 putative inactive tyrosine-protein kinase Wsck [Macrosteles quadrilineatus]
MNFVFLIFFTVFINIKEIENLDLNGEYIGCFQHQSANHSDLALYINGTSAAQTVDNCLSSCLEHFFRYAGILNGQSCLCGSSYGSQGAGNCTQQCYGNSTQLCGGLQATSVYATGFLVPGPPKNIIVNQTGITETRIGLQWEPPDAANGNLSLYYITANASETFSQSPVHPRSWTYPASLTRVGLLSLSPGTQYNVSITAANEFGAGRSANILVWTQIKEPSPPESPEVVKKDKGTITVRLKPAINEFGPISKYRIIVSEEETFFDHKYLKSWYEYKKEDLPYYIAAELSPESVTNGTEFVVGDGKHYKIEGDRDYYNAPLQANRQFLVTLGVVSSFQGITKASYSSSARSRSQQGVVLLDVPPVGSINNDGLTTILKGAIIVCGFLLLVSICIYIFVHKKYGGRRYLRRDQQELNVRGPMTEVENSAFVYDEYLPEEENKKVDYYDMLHQRIWNIPRNFLDLQPEVLGEGNFGTVYKGTVQRKGQVTPVAIYAIQDGDLPSDDKRSMLENLDVLVRGGDHKNTLSLTGTCESQDTLYIVLEHHPATLKDILLQSRCLQHSEFSKSRFCSLSESTLLDFLIGVAQGMSFLASKRIVHKQLTCSNILMADGVLPKITGFGIAQYSRRNKVPDYTRWSAQEVLARGMYVTKSDVWSFGVVLWEACALGGTPYAEVGREQVVGGVLRGLRLPQLSYVGDTLYQLMLYCWQIDLDERPNFPEIISDLESIKMSPELLMELSFNTYKDFQYETCSTNLEHN